MISKTFVAWGERFLFAPTFLQKILALIFLPFALFYCLIVFVKYLFALIRPHEFSTPIISIGNLVLGGSGKTPFTIAMAQHYAKSAVILRGYGRASKGTKIVSLWGELRMDVTQSGDEAMLLARSLPHALIIVASNRLEGIAMAESEGAQLIWLDDGYSKHFIKKMDILLEPAHKSYLPLCLPSGPYREKLWWGKGALIVQEERDFTRSVTVKDATQKMLLVTAISKPWRLDSYLPEGVIAKVYYPDHYPFSKEEVLALMEQYQVTSIVTTQKDAVKLESFGVKLSILELKMQVDATIMQTIDHYIKETPCRKK